MRIIASTGLVSAVLAASFHSYAAPRVNRAETINFANLMSSVGTIYVAPGKTKEYYLYGPWLDFASKVTLLGSTQQIVEKRTLFNADGGLLRVKLTGSGGRGITTAVITISCPPIPFTDCAPSTTFRVMVLGVGTVSSIDPADNVAPSATRSFRVRGSGLDNSTVFLFRTDLKNVAVQGNSGGTLDFTGTTSSCGTNRVIVRDVAEGGDFYPFPGGLDIHLSTACGTRTGSTSLITGTSTAGGPDLQPITGVPLLRHLAPNRKIASEPFCHGMFAQAVTAIVKTITVGDIVWGVKNTGGSNVTTQFHAQLFRNGVLVRDQVVNSLNAGASVTFTYSRPQSQTEVARLGLVPESSTRQIYNATGGECVQTVGQDSQFDWQDPQYEIRVDPARAIANDINAGNNNRSF